MKTLAAKTMLLPLLATLTACGGPQEIVTTNTGNVIPDGARSNMTYTNDEPANATAGRMMDANEAAAMNMAVNNASDGTMMDANASNAM